MLTMNKHVDIIRHSTWSWLELLGPRASWCWSGAGQRASTGCRSHTRPRPPPASRSRAQTGGELSPETQGPVWRGRPWGSRQRQRTLRTRRERSHGSGVRRHEGTASGGWRWVLWGDRSGWSPHRVQRPPRADDTRPPDHLPQWPSSATALTSWHGVLWVSQGSLQHWISSPDDGLEISWRWTSHLVWTGPGLVTAISDWFERDNGSKQS